MADDRHFDEPPVAVPPAPPAPSYPASPEPADWIGRLLAPVCESKGWLKFLGVAAIVIGALHALSIFGLIVAWIYIWIGILLWQAGGRAEIVCARRDAAALEQYLAKLKSLITIGGVLAVISIAISVVALMLVFSLGVLAWLAQHF